MRQTWINLVLPAVLWLGAARAYDGYSACPKTYRTVRQWTQLPCDFQQQSWCTIPGSAYPWHAVRRFVHENHGLMRRMYGDERHISVLRAEIESNDVELMRDPGWHLEDDVKRRYSAKPHFRPANRNHHHQQQQPPPPPPPPLPPLSSQAVSSAVPAPPTAATVTTTSVPSTTTSASAFTTTPSTTSTSTSTTSTTTTEGSSTATTSEESASEPLGLYNGRIHPHIFNASGLASSSSRPTSTSTTTSTALPTTTSTAADTTLDEWMTDETTLTTLETSTSARSSPATSTTTSPPSSTPSASSSTASPIVEQDEELADVEDNVADEQDGEVEADSAGSGQETLFQDADNQPGPDAAQQPSRPATPLIKLRGVNACPVKEEVVAPFWANNTRGEVLALLNLYPFEQYVHWEKCTHEHKQMFCREGCRCEQQYRLHRLLAYDPNNECRGIFSDWFKFPSCCICRCYDLPAEFRFTSRSPRTPVLRDRGPRRPRPSLQAASAKDWYRLQQASSGGGG